MKSEHMWGPTQVVSAIVVVVVLILIAILLIGVSGGPGSTREIGPGQVLRTAQAGDVIKDFPKDLLLEDGIAITESFSVEYKENNQKQPVVKYASAKTMEENIEMFAQFFGDNGWDIVHEANLEEDPVFYYAKTIDEDVNVTFLQGENGVSVSISYLKK